MNQTVTESSIRRTQQSRVPSDTRSLKTGVLLVNLGTPDSPAVPDVHKYLREFLMDGRVLDIPFLGRWALVNLIIAPFRAPKSAKIYRQLWEEEGSPLKFYGHRVEKLLQAKLGNEYVVKLAMRYQSPSIKAGLDTMRQAGLQRIVVIPAFPQYASASTGSVYEKVMDIVGHWQTIPEISFTNTFFDRPQFIQAITEAARRYMAQTDFDYFLFSYHGIPERQITKGDVTGQTCRFGTCCDTLSNDNQLCYRAQCFATTRLLVKELGLKEGTYITSFQSRLGSTPWIKPYTDEVIKDLAKQGKKKVLAFSPAFVADCLETTVEVGDEYKELFEENGGEHWQLVESLNDSPLFVELLAEMVGEKG
ncbi:MAG: ferrochelatase [Cytophagaceae bacterium]|nr:ferrochelatase [Cytophagaceae bacterium]